MAKPHFGGRNESDCETARGCERAWELEAGSGMSAAAFIDTAPSGPSLYRIRVKQLMKVAFRLQLRKWPVFGLCSRRQLEQQEAGGMVGW